MYSRKARKHGNWMSTGGVAPRNPLAAKAPRRRREVKKAAEVVIRNCTVVIRRMSQAEIDVATGSSDPKKLQPVTNMRRTTGGKAPIHPIFRKFYKQ
jgi:hypothetical protein